MAAPGKVSVGPTTVAGSSVTIAAFAVAVVAFAQGARDEETFSALAVGGLSLLATLGGRFGQAIAQALSYGKGIAPAEETVDLGDDFFTQTAAPKPRRKPKGS